TRRFVASSENAGNGTAAPEATASPTPSGSAGNIAPVSQAGNSGGEIETIEDEQLPEGVMADKKEVAAVQVIIAIIILLGGMTVTFLLWKKRKTRDEQYMGTRI
ncbi:MAG: hypothetical protein AB1Z19_09630, partial [Eubacteriales bacterium]